MRRLENRSVGTSIPGVKRFLAFLSVCLLATASPAGDAVETILLHASNATIQAGGGTAKFEPGANRQCVGFWNTTNTVVSWKTRVPAKATYRVVVVYASLASQPGSDVELTIGSQRANGLAKPTGDWGKFVELDLGPVLIRRPGELEVSARATRMGGGGGAWNLRAVRLVPEP